MRECYEKTEFGGERDQIEKEIQILTTRFQKKKEKEKKKITIPKFNSYN